MVGEKGTTGRARVDGLLRGLGWVRFTGARADDARVERVVRVMLDSGAWGLVLRAFDLLLLRPEVVRWFEESVDALGNAGYEEDAARAARDREDGKAGEADSLMARYDDLVNEITGNLRATITNALHSTGAGTSGDDDASKDRGPVMDDERDAAGTTGSNTGEPHDGQNDDAEPDALDDGDVVLAEEVGVRNDGAPILRGVALDVEPTEAH